MPTRYRDLETVAMFMAAVLKAWCQSMLASAPSKSGVSAANCFARASGTSDGVCRRTSVAAQPA